MSYARFAIDSNVYVYTMESDSIACVLDDEVAKKLDLGQVFYAHQTLEPGISEKLMLGHLLYLKSRGVLVPSRATDQLILEIAKMDGWT